MNVMNGNLKNGELKRRFGEEIFRLRTALHIKQQDFAKILGISPVLMNHVERGRRALKILELVRLRETYGVSIDHMIDSIVEDIGACADKKGGG